VDKHAVSAKHARLHKEVDEAPEKVRAVLLCSSFCAYPLAKALMQYGSNPVHSCKWLDCMP
jgi:hypothetical protein